MMYRFCLAVMAACAWMIATSAAEAKVVITVDKSAQEMTVVVDGVQRWRWPVSTGRRGYATPSGRYTAFRMEKDHYSKEWDDAPMPHSIFFTKRGHAIHGTNDARHIGAAVSHGCVRLNLDNATKLFALVKEQGVTNATVVITGGDNSPAVARTAPRRAPRQYQTSEAEQPTVYRRQAPAFGNPTFGFGGQRYYDPRYSNQPSYQRDNGGFFRW
jgi:hypothetical protein